MREVVSRIEKTVATVTLGGRGGAAGMGNMGQPYQVGSVSSADHPAAINASTSAWQHPGGAASSGAWQHPAANAAPVGAFASLWNNALGPAFGAVGAVTAGIGYAGFSALNIAGHAAVNMFRRKPATLDDVIKAQQATTEAVMRGNIASYTTTEAVMAAGQGQGQQIAPNMRGLTTALQSLGRTANQHLMNMPQNLFDATEEELVRHNWASRTGLSSINKGFGGGLMPPRPPQISDALSAELMAGESLLGGGFSEPNVGLAIPGVGISLKNDPFKTYSSIYGARSKRKNLISIRPRRRPRSYPGNFPGSSQEIARDMYRDLLQAMPADLGDPEINESFGEADEGPSEDSVTRKWRNRWGHRKGFFNLSAFMPQRGRRSTNPFTASPAQIEALSNVFDDTGTGNMQGFNGGMGGSGGGGVSAAGGAGGGGGGRRGNIVPIGGNIANRILANRKVLGLGIAGVAALGVLSHLDLSTRYNLSVAGASSVDEVIQAQIQRETQGGISWLPLVGESLQGGINNMGEYFTGDRAAIAGAQAATSYQNSQMYSRSQRGLALFGIQANVASNRGRALGGRQFAPAQAEALSISTTALLQQLRMNSEREQQVKEDRALSLEAKASAIEATGGITGVGLSYAEKRQMRDLRAEASQERDNKRFIRSDYEKQGVGIQRNAAYENLIIRRDESIAVRQASAAATNIDNATRSIGYLATEKPFSARIETEGGQTGLAIEDVRNDTSLSPAQKSIKIRKLEAYGNAQLDLTRQQARNSILAGTAGSLGNFINFAGHSGRDFPDETLDEIAKKEKEMRKSLSETAKGTDTAQKRDAVDTENMSKAVELLSAISQGIGKLVQSLNFGAN